MMELPELPQFDIPDRRPKVPPPEVLYKWLSESVRRLKQSGQMVRIREQASRRPADARFVL